MVPFFCCVALEFSEVYLLYNHRCCCVWPQELVVEGSDGGFSRCWRLKNHDPTALGDSACICRGSSTAPGNITSWLYLLTSQEFSGSGPAHYVILATWYT